MFRKALTRLGSSRRVSIGAVTVALSLVALLATPSSAVTAAQFVDQNERAHNNQMEWWYITGHLTGVDTNGVVHNYGFQDTFFKNHPWWGYDGYSQEMAVTDLNRGTYTQGQKQGTGVTSTACCSGYNVGIDDWDLQGDNGYHRVYGNVNWGDYVLDLTMNANKPAALHGGDGYVPFQPFGTQSGYYSWTGLDVGGTVWDHGLQVTITGGEAWMDHQWYDGYATGGWDWYSIQLDNNVDYMVFLIKDANGNYVTKFGTQVAADGTTTELTSSQVSMSNTNGVNWTSPRSSRTYRLGWTVTVPGGSLTITPQVLDQESNLSIPAIDYWEGTATVSGMLNGVAVTGKSYTEITQPQCLCGF